ncbi:MAG TPA: aryl-sulfate sulfotransferase [Bdellovibrionales bacterium]|nr:aryl-sulfate sulfotransferase [Bdellovibrionales bacterium]
MLKIVSEILVFALLTTTTTFASETQPIANVDDAYLRWNRDRTEVDILEYRKSKPPTWVLGKKIVFQPRVATKKGGREVWPQPFVISRKEGTKTKNVRVNLFKPVFPAYRTQGESVLKSSIVASVFDVNGTNAFCQLMKWAPNGDLEFYRYTDGSCSDFRPHLVNGKKYYTYGKLLPKPVRGTMAASIVVLDENFDFVREIPGEFDQHDFLLLGDDHFVSIESALRRTSQGLLFSDRIVREHKAGKIEFEWSISDYMKHVKVPQTAGAYIVEDGSDAVAELVHLNSVQMLPNEVIIGLGDSGVVSVNRKTRAINWILGGFHDEFGLTFQQHPYFVHSSKFDPSTNRLLIFQNRTLGSALSFTPSRVTAYEIDPKKKALKSFKVIRAGKEITPFLGSVQESAPDVYSIGFGKNMTPDAEHFVEFANGRDTMSLRFLTPNSVTYRFYREP